MKAPGVSQTLLLLWLYPLEAAPQLSVTPGPTGEVTLNWTASGVLERSRELQGSWESIPEAGDGWKTAPTDGTWFFRVRSAFPLQVTVEGSGSGQVEAVPEGWVCRDSCRRMMDERAMLQLLAMPDPGSVFVGGTGDFFGPGDCVLTMDGEKRVTATFDPAGPTTGFVNGDFEQGPTAGWQQEPDNMIYTAVELGVAPYSGQYAAWVGYQPDNRRWAAISQVVTLPDAWPVYVNFAIWLYSEELCDPPWWDTFGVYVNGVAVEENSHLCQGNTGGDGWRRISLDASTFAGQSVLIKFQISSVDTLASVALIDDVSISSSPW